MSNKNGRGDLRTSTRDEEVRPQTSWTPPALLDAPQARPGFRQRWVATTILGKETPDNVYKRMREGWEPRKSDTVKEQNFPTINHGQWVGCIGIEGMVLCEMPEEKHNAMKAYYEEKSHQQNDALSGELDSLGRRSGQTIYQDRKSSSSRGRVSAMED
jgi:hypothetical protein|tara:strand:- start:1092 stop:1565 length:474 start_codon:yes stop_codon:yes gene_type:complete